jgi:riboflavin biosynthesis protein RibD
MAQALRLAACGLGRTSPNPPVGAVVARDGRVLGAGYHRQAGGPHAEVFALRQAGVKARGATLYVTLEPCCHLDKRTPPCVPLILKSGIERVVVATADPNPQVRGRGIAALKRAGLKVEVGIGRFEAERLIEAYRSRITTGYPNGDGKPNSSELRFPWPRPSRVRVAFEVIFTTAGVMAFATPVNPGIVVGAASGLAGAGAATAVDIRTADGWE